MSPRSSFHDWKEVVRDFFTGDGGRYEEMEQEMEKTILQRGEFVLVSGVQRADFIAASENEDFARRWEWRLGNCSIPGVGDVVVMKMPSAAHETALRALDRAVTLSVSAPSSEIASHLIPTGSTRFTDESRSSEPHGGFRPVNAPANEANQGAPPIKSCTAPSVQYEHITPIFFQSSQRWCLRLLTPSFGPTSTRKFSSGFVLSRCGM